MAPSSVAALAPLTAAQLLAAVDDTNDAAMGVEEYAIHWPYRTDDGPKLFGCRRNEDGAWVTWGTDEEGVLLSAMLGGLGMFSDQAPWLRLRNMAGERLLSAMEVVEQADREAAARRHADTRATQEAVARREAKAEVARLRALGRAG